MPARFYSFFRFASPALFALVLGASFALHASPAHADPHAVFYTDRAQEQLFYNVLAALNQADYVEPGIPGSPYSRTQLVTNRTLAPGYPGIPSQTTLPFQPENNPTINATHTNLPSVVSRNVTLEGNDVWTAYLVQQFALETATRRDENELARVFCERGLGIPGCDTDSIYANQLQSSAFVTNPDSLQSAVNAGVDSTLASGTQAESNLETQIAKNDENTQHNPSDPLYFPRPANGEIAALNQNIEANNQQIGAEAVSNIAHAITSPNNGIDPTMFQDITVSNGEIKPSESAVTTADAYLDKLQSIANLPAQLLAAANEGAGKQLAFINNLTNTPEMGSFRLAPNPNSGGLTATVTDPSGAQQAMVQALANLEANAAINQHYASAEAINNPGSQQLVTAPLPSVTPLPPGTLDNLPNTSNVALNPSQADGLQLAIGSTPQQGEVAGATTQQGQVAGTNTTTDQIYNLNNNTFGSPPKTALSPSVNAINPDRETGMYDALVALTDNTYRKNSTGTSDSKCAFCMQMNIILQNAQGYLGNLYCTLYPDTPACFSRKPSTTPVVAL